MSTKISILAPNNDEIIGYIGSFVKHSEDNESIVFECSRFCFKNASIAECYQNKKKFSVAVMDASGTGEILLKQDDCFIQDHSFCFTPNVSDKAKIKAYKNPSFNKEDIETYEKWLESRFVW